MLTFPEIIKFPSRNECPKKGSQYLSVAIHIGFWIGSIPMLFLERARERETQTKLINGWSRICIDRVTYLLANMGWVGLDLGLIGRC